MPVEKALGFWATVGLIEVTDVAFAIDSILAAIALVGPAPVGHVGSPSKALGGDHRRNDWRSADAGRGSDVHQAD